jgi:hypothetical protein
MKKLHAVLLAGGIFFSCQTCFAWNIAAHCETRRALPDADFQEQFPFRECLETAQSPPKAWLLRLRAALLQAQRQDVADNILYELAEYRISTQPIDITNLPVLQTELEQAEPLLAQDTKLDSAANFILNSIGHRYYGAAAYAIEAGVTQKRLDQENPAFHAILALLKRNQYMPNIPTSNAQKFVRHLKDGNWAYIWDRFKTRYLKDALLALSLALNGIIILRYLIKKIRRRKGRVEKKSNTKVSAGIQLVSHNAKS